MVQQSGDADIGMGDVEVQVSPPAARYMRRASTIAPKDPGLMSIDGDGAAMSDGQESMGDEFQVHLLDYKIKSGGRSMFQPKALLYPGASHQKELC
jgi:hypothetical protein